MVKTAKNVCPRCGALHCNQRFHERKPIYLSKVWFVDDLNPVDDVHCHNCGLCFVVSRLDVEDGYLESDDEFEYVPNYCPNCGAKVVYE